MKNFIKNIAPFEVLLILFILGVHLVAAQADAYAFPNRWFTRDDAYYYFKVAQNISAGYGSTFDQINFSNGYHPLWLLICIPIFAFAKYDLILPLRILLVVIAAIQAATSALIYRLLKAHLSHAVAVAATAFWSFNIYVNLTVYRMGLETPIAAFFIVLILYALSKFESRWRVKSLPLKQIAWLSALAALVMFSRLDLVFFAVLLGAWIIFRNAPALRFLLPLDAVAFFAALTAAAVSRAGFVAYNATYVSSALLAAGVAVVCKIIVLYVFGGYLHPRALPLQIRFVQLFFALIIGSFASAVIFIFLDQLGWKQDFPRLAFLADLGISFVWIFASRLAAYWFADPSLVRAEAPLDQLKSNWKIWLQEGLTYYGVLGGALAAYMLYNRFAFGTSSPVSGQIKRWWGSLRNTIYGHPAEDWPSFFGVGIDSHSFFEPYVGLARQTAAALKPYVLKQSVQNDERYLLSVVVYCALWILVAFIYKRRTALAARNLSLVPLAAGSAAHVLSYTATAYSGAKEWYWISEMILLLFAGSLFLDLILKPLRKSQLLNFGLMAIAIIYAVNSADKFWANVSHVMPRGRFSPDQPLVGDAAFLEENVPSGEVIGMLGGGNIGYFIKDRTIVNMDGLINSYDYFQALKKGEAPVYLHEKGVTVVFASSGLLEYAPYSGQFAPYLQNYGAFGGRRIYYLLPTPKY
ncbi:MAG: hypothetical protein LC099_05600 [Anaerolineales bacterium]|nr:hypothetical protein [Anaerolineales bacterium]